MIEVVLSLEDGRNLSVRSQHEDGTGVHGLYLISGPSTPARLACPAAEIYQTRELTELPKGPMQVVELRRDVSGCVVEMFLGVNSSVIRLLSGEVYEREEDQFEVVEVDESILIQVDGKKPRVPDGP
ncbi:hypothetical protein [Pseudorhodoferax sp.]|uniref:hypothetical protein n=1 Tax=Pseudorhodoferax sp. TaxID=1993553 RepID=UPI002DD6504C|nr:hypothetical protein [Pseudorhodoferax sp.]